MLDAGRSSDAHKNLLCRREMNCGRSCLAIGINNSATATQGRRTLTSCSSNIRKRIRARILISRECSVFSVGKGGRSAQLTQCVSTATIVFGFFSGLNCAALECILRGQPLDPTHVPRLCTTDRERQVIRPRSSTECSSPRILAVANLAAAKSPCRRR